MNEVINDIFKKCGLVTNNVEDLQGQTIPRDFFLNETRYNNIKEDIIKLKKHLNSSMYTSLHKNAEIKQNWPFLNLIRQLLRFKKYNMRPFKKSDGYTKDGKKKFIRYFVIEKVNQNEVITELVSEE